MINILFGGNDKVFNGILLCLLSMIKHTNKPLNVYILTADLQDLNKNFTPLTEHHVKTLNDVIKSKNPNSSVILFKLGKEFKSWVNGNKNRLSSYTPFAFLRLFADTLNLPDKVLYLDTDIMLNGDITKLYNTDISNYELGVVLDRYGKFFIKPSYFNSGVLLMNMQKIKESNLLERVRKMCEQKKLPFPDQDALNKLCKSKLYLPRKYNEQGKLKKDTVVQHFTKKFTLFPYFHTVNIKPWHIDNVQNKLKIHAYDDIYETFKQINPQ